MRQKFVSKNGHKALLLFFAGWGADDGPFGSLAIEGYDTLVAWDYRTSAFDDSALEGYEEIVVAAWSFGVVAASRFLSGHPGLPVTLTVAVNGTPVAVDDTLGIPPAIFEATAANLTERSLAKFYRRMCDSRAECDAYTARLTPRAIADLVDELYAIRAIDNDVCPAWNYAFVGSRDLIIPPDNQKCYWRLTPATNLSVIDAPHLVSVGDILSKILVDKSLVARRFSRCRATYDANAGAQRRIADTLAAYLPADNRGDVLEAGCGTGLFTRHLLAGAFDTLTLVDLNPGNIGGHEVVGADAELYIRRVPDESLDLIVASSVIQWFNSPAGFIAEARRALRRGGLVMISTFGPATYRELGASAPSLPLPDAGQWRAILSPLGMEATVADETFSLTFDSPIECLRHIKLTGVNSITADGAATARRLLRDYPRNADGTYSLTYQPIYLILKKCRK